LEIQVKGLDSLLKKLSQLGDDVNEGLKEALLAGGQVVQKSAKELCPVDTTYLRESISLNAIDDNTVVVSTNVDYAIFVEFGTGPKGDPAVEHTSKQFWRFKDKDGNWVTSHGQAPQPFMRPALENNTTQIVEAVKNLLSNRLEGLSR
jgi:HK97 gp10 family phage protein